MIYVLAFFLPPLALLLEGKVFSALFNLILIVLVIVLSLLTLFTFAFLLLIPSLHAIIVIAQARRKREHEELVEAARSGKLRIDR
ncbi:putative membrane protein YqiK [Amorphus suaedae]